MSRRKMFTDSFVFLLLEYIVLCTYACKCQNLSYKSVYYSRILTLNENIHFTSFSGYSKFDKTIYTEHF